MISHLKKRYILLNMVIINLLLITMFVYLYISTVNSMDNFGERFLGSVLDRYIHTGEVVQRSNDTYAIIELDADSKPHFIFNTTAWNEKDLLHITNEVLDLNTSFGKLQDYPVIYHINTDTSPAVYVVADNSFQLNTLRSLLFRLIGIWFAANLVFAFISYKLSIYISKPILKSWDQQKQFLSDASHELKTPLTVLLTNTTILKKMHRDDVETTKWLNNMDHENKRMRYLVDELLFLAKSDEGRDQQFMTQVSLSDILEQSVLVFEASAFEKKLLLLSDIKDHIELMCIPDQIRQLVAILIDNAVKYAVPGEEIRVTLDKNDHGTSMTVRNNLTLINDKDLPKIFDRFYRADSARTNMGNNYGLGLSIAKKIADTHNAAIHVVSTKELGTVFTVKFKN